MARQSACRATDTADQRITAKSQRKTTISVIGCAMISTSRLPVPQKIATVPKPISSENSLRILSAKDWVLFAWWLGFAFPDMGASISSRSRPCDQAIAPVLIRMSIPLAKPLTFTSGTLSPIFARRLASVFFAPAAEILRVRLCRLSPCRFPPQTSAFVSSTLSRSHPHRIALRTYLGLQTARPLSRCELPYFSPTTLSYLSPDQCRAFPLAYFPSRALLR